MAALRDHLRDGAPVSISSVLVVGTGLIGTSVALALREHGLEVYLADRDDRAVRLARELGAGREWPPPGGRDEIAPVDLAVVAVPPPYVADELLRLQREGAARCYTDVASVKALPLERAAAIGCDLSSYLAGHPLAGSERSGPAAARADLFLGRPWAYCPTEQTSPDAVEAVLSLIKLCGAEPVRVGAAEHDEAVAIVSHAPHVTAAAVAARLAGASETALSLAGQGVRDVTRIAAGDPDLWTGILSGNALPVAAVLEAIAADLAAAAAALRRTARAGEPAMAEVTDLLRRGVTGRGRIPGKHGGPARAYAVVQVVIGDRPGELARLFQVAEEVGVNIEDVRLEHAPGLPLGMAELSVQPEAAGVLAAALRAQGWDVPG
ncbi:prephenate dehydrogenase [Thermopolyspora flexuosa]|uniref:Prephenate dehydrogenase n=1 Tax=Thermopolyspora flexuosa TaxID=103836 RepID=A0A543IZG3_9ACTN|nr:prephenate dehydrogenase [Thermopolyspora flexuosa]TQM75941.1 prephenate dehydrogenase [Thermopolyspora flexuosa]GGM63377.1 prephenate dehydrogenase [Thermopolyspora flexuosa]